MPELSESAVSVLTELADANGVPEIEFEVAEYPTPLSARIVIGYVVPLVSVAGVAALGSKLDGFSMMAPDVSPLIGYHEEPLSVEYSIAVRLEPPLAPKEKLIVSCWEPETMEVIVGATEIVCATIAALAEDGLEVPSALIELTLNT